MVSFEHFYTLHIPRSERRRYSFAYESGEVAFSGVEVL